MLYRSFFFCLALFLPLAVGFGASQISSQSFQIYTNFILPPLAPPAYVFGPVWTILYALMGLASYFIFRAKAEKAQKIKALALYAAQLVVNFFWTYFFFVLQWRLFAFFWLLFLLSLLFLCMKSFRNISPWAFILLIPYASWLFFAAYLNISLYMLNKI